MKWLRGAGVEIGAGRHPTPLFGQATAAHVDLDADSAQVFGTADVGRRYSLGDPVPDDLKGSFDFVIASHVLEHADSLIRAVQHLVDLARPGGSVYVTLPDRSFLDDARWMPRFDMDHHVEEFQNPDAFIALHDRLILDYRKGRAQGDPAAAGQLAPGAGSDPEFSIHLLEDGKGSAIRFMLHKHTYDADGWNSLFVDIQRFIAVHAPSADFAIVETRYGMERFDCHFMLRKR
jgi:SAM-dependent methyltransferase